MLFIEITTKEGKKVIINTEKLQSVFLDENGDTIIRIRNQINVVENRKILESYEEMKTKLIGRV